MRHTTKLVAGFALAGMFVWAIGSWPVAAVQQPVESEFQVDPFWPKQLPNGWVLGNVVGVAVDSQDHVWLAHRPNSLPAAAETPPILVFDGAGNLIRSWGGPGEGYEWGTQQHGLYVDPEDNVWVGFGGGLPYEPWNMQWYGNAMFLKFTPDGEFLLQIGKWGKGLEGSNSTEYLGGPSDAWVDPQADEVFISDGYLNRRVIVFDATTGAYKRHWGAYGERPTDGAQPARVLNGPPRRQFDTPHCLVGSGDGLIYVCDRGNSRTQVFRRDGTFVSEGFFGSSDIALSPDSQQRLMYVVGAGGFQTVERESLQLGATYARPGRMAGQFLAPHSIAIDSGGNLFVSETLAGSRIQKFVPVTQ